MEKTKDIFASWLHDQNIERLLIILVGVLFILLVTYYLKKIISRHVSNSANKYRSRKAVNVLGYILIISIVLFVYSDKLGNIGIALGLAGAGIAFALQEVITSIAGWINIMTTNSIRIGQRVKIGEIKGDVIDIGVLKTTIMEVGDWVDGDLYNGRITDLSNSFVFKEPIQNYSADYPFLWDEITVPIRTESDFNLARKIFSEVAVEVCGEYSQKSEKVWAKMTDKYRIEDADVQPLITLTFDENWITYTIRYVVDFKKRRSTKDHLFTRLLEEINHYDNIIMIATTSVEVTNVSQTEINKTTGNKK
ncbi:mechanosensitive ion channel family protein [Ancylomarina euxinus]|uniref:Mechanosensitive ion channel family protein n=1 Tax=Ancylomarina euxinus TaxID=2283627 RepID=A0A425Y462_9BACT|nr:mechanosensitive ion channel domain-containing protein [Ancylomarina euxinus]MCZ4694674.1 mechanosensitive ion channel [Ancylomarina euxinus]MUP14218.1 mechanosensitive ion channel [Ancylomarina euxinus]RRG23070.1 mechanosensitive ion channel family protein [Ancylomarina euxinus]